VSGCVLTEPSLAYRLEFKKCIARTPEEKNQMKDAKQKIQRGYKEDLIIDVPKHGSETSNNAILHIDFFEIHN